MEVQIRRALQTIVQSFQLENMQYLQHLRHALQNIVEVLSQQQQALRQHHQIQLNKLKTIIVQKQIQIQKLKSDRHQLNELRELKNRSNTQVTPCRILLKNNTRYNLKQVNVPKQNKQNHQNQIKQLSGIMDEAFSNICLSSLKQNRLSLQLCPGKTYACFGNDRKLSRVSSNIKNKIIQQNSKSNSNIKQHGQQASFMTNTLKNHLSPRGFPPQRCQVSETTYTTLNTNYGNVKTEVNNSKITGIQCVKSPRRKAVNAYNSRREQFLRVVQCSQNKNQWEAQGQNKGSEKKQRARLCRKPSNKNKRELVQKKRFGSTQSNGNLTYRNRCPDATIPIKIITMADMKSR